MNKCKREGCENKAEYPNGYCTAYCWDKDKMGE